MSPMQCTSMTKKIDDSTVRLLVALKLSHGRLCLYMIRSIPLLLPLVQWNLLASRRRRQSLILQLLLCWSFQRKMFACTGSLSRTTSRKPVDDRKVNRFDIHNGDAPCAGSAHDGVEEEDPMTKCTRWQTSTFGAGWNRSARRPQVENYSQYRLWSCIYWET
jgi:hypothetical protein